MLAVKIHVMSLQIYLHYLIKEARSQTCFKRNRKVVSTEDAICSHTLKEQCHLFLVSLHIAEKRFCFCFFVFFNNNNNLL